MLPVERNHPYADVRHRHEPGGMGQPERAGEGPAKLMDLALHYADKGWPMFPVTPGGKLPLIARARGGHGYLDATIDRSRIEEWWRAYPEANIGIATGRASKLLVIDVDPRNCVTWLASLHQLELPETYTVRTASGGWHLYFEFSGDRRIGSGANLLPGIDWRGNGGYVVAAGSRVNGKSYEVAKHLPIALAPALLLDRILVHHRLARPVRVAGGHSIIPEGQRNETLFAMACLLRRFGIDFNAIYGSLRAVNADHCQPPIEDEELRRIAASAMRYEPSNSS